METLFKILSVPKRSDGWYGLIYHGFHVEARVADEDHTSGLFDSRIINLKLRPFDGKICGPVVFEYNSVGGIIVDELNRNHFLRNMANVLVNIEFYIEDVA